MRRFREVGFAVMIAAVLLTTSFDARADDIGVGERFFDVARGGKPAATLVAPADEAPIWDDAIEKITAITRRWGGKSPGLVRLPADAPLPPGDLVLLGTPATSNLIATLSDKTDSQVSRVPFADDQGFAIESRNLDDRRVLVIAGKTPRGTYNGAVFCRDFLLDATSAPPGKADVFVREASILRSPYMLARGTYLLSIYGAAMKYTADDWMRIIDRFAEDGMERVYFWLSGHHPSKKYPHLYNVDATTGTKLTVDGVHRLIRYCHNRDIEFYIGGGVFAWTASHYLLNGHPEIQAEKAGGQCPNKAYARTGNREHFLEMLDTWSEADGFMFEIRDEHGECQCKDCAVKLDEFGSRGYGKAEITWLQETARQAWKRNPELKFSWLIGYEEHKNDVYYYDQIRHMNDPRFEWLDTRVGLDGQGKWVLPGPAGKSRPFAFFSRAIIHWDPFYVRHLDHLAHWAGRIADEGLYGYVPAFEPGFGSASYYSDEIPLPLDILPYCLTGFAYREVTWEPGITVDQLKERVHRRYFSPGTPERFVEDMVYLRQFSIDHWNEICSFSKPRYHYDGHRIEPLTIAGELDRVRAIEDEAARKTGVDGLLKKLKKLATVSEHLTKMSEIEASMKKDTPQATRKTREGFALLRRMIDDTRVLYRTAVPDTAALEAAISELEK